jgi:hypothetical protein
MKAEKKKESKKAKASLSQSEKETKTYTSLSLSAQTKGICPPQALFSLLSLLFIFIFILRWVYFLSLEITAWLHPVTSSPSLLFV